MDWIDIFLLVFMGIGVLAGAYSFGRSPSAWLEVLTAGLKQFGPLVFVYLSRQEDPDTREKRNAVTKSGGQWDYVNKRERNK